MTSKTKKTLLTIGVVWIGWKLLIKSGGNSISGGYEMKDGKYLNYVDLTTFDFKIPKKFEGKDYYQLREILMELPESSNEWKYFKKLTQKVLNENRHWKDPVYVYGFPSRERESIKAVIAFHHGVLPKEENGGFALFSPGYSAY